MYGKAILTIVAALAVAVPAGAQSAQGWLGVMQRPAGDGQAVVVDEVLEGSPAGRAGVQVGDTIVLWNGRRDVAVAVRERALQPGDTVRLRVRRGAQRDRDVAVVAGPRPAGVATMRREGGDDVIVLRPTEMARQLRLHSDSLALRADSLHQRVQTFLRDSLGTRLRELERFEMPDIEIRMREMEDVFRRGFPSDAFVFDLGRRAVGGAEFAPLNEGLADYFGTTTGVLVLTVAPETPAARAGLLSGDVVVEVDGTTVDDVAELRRLVTRPQARETRRVQLQVLRKGQRRNLEMRWE